LLINKHKYLLSFFVLIIAPVLALAQEVKVIHTKTLPPDTIKNDSLPNFSADSLNDYEIIYEFDTIRLTKLIIDYDTIFQFDSLTKKIFSDTPKPLLSNRDSALIPVAEKEKYFSAGLHFSTFIFSNNLSVNDQSANTQLDFRKTYEKPLPSFSLALTPEYKFNRWSIQSGVQYSLLRNKYDYPFQNGKYISSIYMQDTSYSALQNDTIDIYYQVTGTHIDTIYVINQEWGTVHDSVPETKIDTTIEEQTKKGVQYYHFIEIPLIFGYEFMHHKKLSLEIKTGVITSFLIYRKGEIISYNGAQTFISLLDYPFIATFFSGYMGLGINYEISKKINFEIHPYYQRSFSSILQKNAPLSQSLDKKGVYVGLQYKF